MKLKKKMYLHSSSVQTENPFHSYTKTYNTKCQLITKHEMDIYSKFEYDSEGKMLKKEIEFYNGPTTEYYSLDYQNSPTVIRIFDYKIGWSDIYENGVTNLNPEIHVLNELLEIIELQLDYKGNELSRLTRNLVKGTTHEIKKTYDKFDKVASILELYNNAESNEEHWSYDDRGNIKSKVRFEYNSKKEKINLESEHYEYTNDNKLCKIILYSDEFRTIVGEVLIDYKGNNYKYENNIEISLKGSCWMRFNLEDIVCIPEPCYNIDIFFSGKSIKIGHDYNTKIIQEIIVLDENNDILCQKYFNIKPNNKNYSFPNTISGLEIWKGGVIGNTFFHILEYKSYD